MKTMSIRLNGQVNPGLSAIRRYLRPKHVGLAMIGHPRCGSKYAAELARSCGLDVGHEVIGADGISSWMFVAEDLETPFGTSYASAPMNVRARIVVHYLRDPFEATPSIIVEDRMTASFRFRRAHIQSAFGFDLLTYDNTVDRAVASYLFWNKLAELRRPDLTVRVEDEGQKLQDFLCHAWGGQRVPSVPPEQPFNNFIEHFGEQAGATTDELASPHFVNMTKPTLTEDHWRSLAPELGQGLRAFCDTYGYAFRIQGCSG